MIVGIPRETFPGETRVALIPADVPALKKTGLEVLVEAGAGVEAGFTDAAYQERGARLVSRGEVFASADMVLQVRAGGANPELATADLALMRPQQYLVAFLEPLWEPRLMEDLAGRNITALSMELIPRISRAQSMDALSSMATISGYKAALLAAMLLPRMYPMLMTAAGTVTPARVFVIGAGVAGLQAIATAKRLGAKVEAYDVRAAAKEQAESVGAKFVELPLDTNGAEDKGGYAKALGDDVYRRQQELLTTVVARSDVVITTAAVPGRRSPLLVTEAMVRGMQPGSVVIDLAAERGGNCALTRPNETVLVQGVTIIGPTNLPATVPNHSSQLYSRNVTNLLRLMAKDGQIQLDRDDEIIRETLVTYGGEVVHPRVHALTEASQPVSKV